MPQLERGNMIITIIGDIDDKNVIESLARDLEENVDAICLTERTEATKEDDLLKECTNTMRKIDKSDILIATGLYSGRISSLVSYAQYTKKLVILARNFYQARPFLWGLRNE
jgi:hypothetical protein